MVQWFTLESSFPAGVRVGHGRGFPISAGFAPATRLADHRLGKPIPFRPKGRVEHPALAGELRTVHGLSQRSGSALSRRSGHPGPLFAIMACPELPTIPGLDLNAARKSFTEKKSRPRVALLKRRGTGLTCYSRLQAAR